jgi:hypothetical protein
MPAADAPRDAGTEAAPDPVPDPATSAGAAPDPVGAEPAMSDASPSAAQDGLSERDRRILALEGRTFRYVGAKERAIREEIGISKIAYYVRLNALLDLPAALRAAPSVVHRLRGRRTSGNGPATDDGSHRVA